MRVLTLSVVHHPEDARILHRQVRALVAAGHEVVQAAPFSDRRVEPRPWVTAVDLPRAVGARRTRALREARAAIRRWRDEVDLVLLHDLEGLAAVAGRLRGLPPVVWDVREDPAAVIAGDHGLPGVLSAPLRGVMREVERSAEQSVRVLLAEAAHVDRFTRPHLVVPDDVDVPAAVPPPDEPRVVHVGTHTDRRGVHDVLAAARLLRRFGVRTELVGEAHGRTRTLLEDATAAGLVTWFGYLPHDRAMEVVEGATAGLCLLPDAAPWRSTLPTRVVEYMAHGVPVVTTPVPRAVDLVRAYWCGVVVPHGDPVDVARTVVALRDDRERRTAMASRGREAARRHHHLPDTGSAFVTRLERWAGAAASPASLPAPAVPA